MTSELYGGLLPTTQELKSMNLPDDLQRSIFRLVHQFARKPEELVQDRLEVDDEARARLRSVRRNLACEYAQLRGWNLAKIGKRGDSNG